MTEDERDIFEDDWAITEAISDKHDISLATGVYRKAQLDLVREGRKAEREKIVRWLRSLDTGLKVPMTLANWIEEGMHNS